VSFLQTVLMFRVTVLTAAIMPLMLLLGVACTVLGFWITRARSGAAIAGTFVAGFTTVVSGAWFAYSWLRLHYRQCDCRRDGAEWLLPRSARVVVQTRLWHRRRYFPLAVTRDPNAIVGSEDLRLPSHRRLLNGLVQIPGNEPFQLRAVPVKSD
jgi:hypothetical protein